MKKITSAFVLLLSLSAFAQKQTLDHSDLALWNTIKSSLLAPNGKHVLFSLEKGEKDNYLKVKDINGATVFEHERSSNGMFSYDSEHVFYTIKAWKDSVTNLKSRKVKKKDLPKDSLGILNIKTKELVKIAAVKSYKIPEEWSGYVAYALEEIKEEKKEAEKDSLSEKKEEKKKPKKVGKKNGYHVVLRNLETKKEDTLKFVTHFTFAKKGKVFVYSNSGLDHESAAGVFIKNLENGQTQNIYSAKKAKFFQLQFSESGQNLGFVVDTDTTKIQIRPNELFHWKEGTSIAEKLLDTNSAPKGYLISSDGKVSFSKDETKLFFGLRRPPIVIDTTLTDDEIVNVEVWTYDEPRLYTVQELDLEKDTIRSYQTTFHLKSNKMVQLATIDFPNSELGNEGDAPYALISASDPYELESQWTGKNYYDYRVVNTLTGETQTALKKTAGLRLSPNSNYAFGYSRKDTTWVTYDIISGARRALTKDKVFYNERHDYPDDPYSYGVAGFTKDDKSIILYDRYDLWEFDPKSGEGNRLTKGRETKTQYRYVQLDKEERYLDPNKKMALDHF